MAQAPYYDYSGDDMADGQLLGGPVPSPPRHRQYQQHPSHHRPQDPYHSPPSHPRNGPPHDPSLDRLRAQRGYHEPPHAPYAAAAPHNAYRDPTSPPRVSAQRDTNRRSWANGANGASHPPSAQRPPPGSDSFNNAAAGGMAGIALGVADHNARENGLDAAHHPHPYQQPPHATGYHTQRNSLAPGEHYPGDRSSHSSLQGLSAVPAGSGYATPGQRTPSRQPGDIYTDDPYQNLSRHQDSSLGMVNPNEIADDGDDGLEYGRRGPRTSMLSLGSSHRGHGAAAAAGAGAGGMLGGLVGRNGSGNVSSQYAPVHNGIPGDGGGGNGSGIFNAGPAGGSATEEPLEKAPMAGGAGSNRKKKWKLAVIILAAVAVIAGIVVGILLGVVFKKDGDGSGGGGSSSGSSSGSTATAADDLRENGDLGADSAEIKALMNNPDLRKVFVGMDYTPINAQYPDCLHHPPSQNNVTRDLAVLSQLTNVVRLYGTDCNQTQMLIHAVDRLRLRDSVKIWLGVWQDNNATTNARQLAQMWDILDRYDEGYFKGVIVANEILFREEMTISALGALLDEVRANMTARGLRLPVATSDLGDKWDASLARQSDAIMANIHPFFAGEPAATAARWTMQFWDNKVSSFLKRDPAMNIISETGWPTQGGMGCGNAWQTDCPDKAVAGIDELNVFMEDWVCGALANGTEYLWFEAFDEPWKWAFNTEGREWEDHWGLMTVNRELKEGVKIPDCGGRRVD